MSTESFQWLTGNMGSAITRPRRDLPEDDGLGPDTGLNIIDAIWVFLLLWLDILPVRLTGQTKLWLIRPRGTRLLGIEIRSYPISKNARIFPTFSGVDAW